MTLGETFKLLARKWYVLLVAVLVGLAVSQAYAHLALYTYKATSTVTVSTSLSEANALAAQVCDAVSTPSMRVERYCNTTTRTVSFRARGNDKAGCIAAANDASERFVSMAADHDPVVTVTATVKADGAKKTNASKQGVAYALIPVLPFIVLAIGAVLIACRANVSQAGRGRHGRRHGRASPVHGSVEGDVFDRKPLVVARRVLYFVMALALVVAANSLYGLFAKVYLLCCVVLLVGSLLVIVPFWALRPLSGKFLARWSAWVALLAVVYAVVVLFHQRVGNMGHGWLMGFLALLPLLLHVIRELGEQERFLSAIPAVVAILGALSLVLWVLGPLAGVIAPDCTIERRWSATGSFRTVAGYFHLLFQNQSLPVGGTVVWRNTGIFPESPMYAFSLGVALCIEVFLRKRPRVAVTVVLALTMLSTMSTTGIVLLIAVCVLSVAFRVPGKWAWLVAALALVGVVLALFVVRDKLAGGSGMTHVDDLVACLSAWLESPLVGHGFDNSAVIKGFMSEFRLYNPGLSNSLGYALATGGILYLVVYLVGFAGYFSGRDRKAIAAGVCLFALWALTTVPRIPLTALVVAVGVERLCALEKATGHAPEGAGDGRADVVGLTARFRQGEGASLDSALKSMPDRLISWARRHKRSYWICYTVLYVLVALLCFLPLILAGKHLMSEIDGLNQGYVGFAYFGWWVRQAIRLTLEAGAPVLPAWDMSFGLGGDEFVNRCSGFFNPFNYISVLVPSRYAEWGYDLVIVLGFYCAGLAFSLFAFEKGNGRFQVLIGAVAYAFSGWTIGALTQFGFIRPAILFPLLLWTAERVFKRKSPVPFIVVSAFLFLGGVHFSYMSFFFLVPYCVYLYLEHVPDRGVRSFVKWVAYFVGLVIVAAAAGALVEVLQVSGITSQSRMGLEKYVPLVFEPSYYVDLVTSFMGFKKLDSGGLLAGGGLALVSCVLVFCSGKIGVNKTVGMRCALVLMLVCLCVPFIGSALNGFQYVSSRWLFAFSLCLSYCVVIAVPNLVDFRKKDLVPLGVVIVLVGLVVFLRPNGLMRSAVVGLCVAVVLFVLLLLSCTTKAGRGVRASVRGLTLLVVAVASICAPFYSLFYLGTGISSKVDVGTAWVRHTTDSIASLVKQVDDDGLWRYDCYAVPRLQNNSALNHVNSFDYYTSYYNNSVNRFFFDLEISDNQTVHRIENLTKRSFLESALGAKYFVVGDTVLLKQRNSNKHFDPAYQPSYYNLPYGFGDEPVAEREIYLWPGKGMWPYYLYENSEALPLAYTFSHEIDQADYYALTATQKQQSLLQAVAVKSPDARKVVDADDLEFDDVRLDYEVVGKSNAKVGEHKVVTKKKDATVTLELADCPPGELYVEFVNLSYANAKPTLAQGASFSEWCAYLKKRYAWTHATDYTVSANSDTGRSALLQGKTKYTPMYGGDDSNIMNLGYIDTSTKQVTLKFGGAGTYKFDEMNVIVQPMDNLDKFVTERRTYPVELTQGVNSFTAKVENDEDQVLFLSIPWSKGWSAEVDGQPAEISLADSAFMAIDLPKGDHVVELRYETPGLKLGLAISVLGWAGVVAVALAYRRFTGATRRKRTRR